VLLVVMAVFCNHYYIEQGESVRTFLEKKFLRRALRGVESSESQSLAVVDGRCSTHGMALLHPTMIPGLRSPFDQTNGLVYFGRMLDKIRLAAAGKLPEGWQPMRGAPTSATFDARCCRFLRIDYAALETETLKGGGDEELLEWAFQNGRRPDADEIEIWNAFMTKRGWRDAGTQRLNQRLAEIGLPPGTVQTMFEFIDLDEGRLKPGAA
jgi:hypothetical protein